MTKGENFEFVFKRVFLYGRVFVKLQLSFFWDFIGSSCKLKPDGALILLICFSACLFLIYANACMLNYISHHISSCISNSSLWYVKCVYELQDIGGYLHDSTLQSVQWFKSKYLTIHIFRGSSSISCNQIPQYWALSIDMFIPVENLTYLSSVTKRGRL